MIVRIKLWLILVVCSCIPFGASSAKFYNVNTLFGISLREVYSVCSDDNGFIWAASKAGVLRMTEGDSKIYHLPYENTNVLTVNLVRDNSRLVAYTNNGQVFLYNPIYDRFELLFDMYKDLGNRYLSVCGVLIDKSGACWIASTTGFYKYNKGQLSLVSEIADERLGITWFDEQHLLLVRDEGI